MPLIISKNRAARIFIIISIWGLLICGVVLLTFPADWFPSFYDVRFFGWAAIFNVAVILLLPRAFLVKENVPDAERKNEGASLFQLFAVIMLLSNAAGDLGLYQLYKVGFEFDKLLHFGNSLMSAFVAPIILNKRFGINLSRAAIVSFFAVIASGLVWEAYEYGVDFIWKTHISGIYGSYVKEDTIRDLIFNSAGAVIGALFAYLIDPKLKNEGVIK
jgi:hypothetical protein